MERLQQILQQAVAEGASDVHLKIGTPVIFRVNRELFAASAPVPDAVWMNQIAQQIVPPHARRQLEEEREADFSYHQPGVGRFRTNLFQQKGEWCISMRYVKAAAPTFDELNLPPVLKEIAASPRGIVLVSGATGCGKSTTLAALVEWINTVSKKHILTLEDPIEFLFEDNQSIIEQREIGLDTLSFAHGLKHVLRQDPDVIMIGEMRDAISFSAAIIAADTGHLVLSTIHTTNATLAIGRILDLFKADEREQIRRQLSGTLRAIICQRLATAVGGGVIPAFEVLINTPIVRKLLEENRLDKLPGAIETSGDEGMMSFNQSLLRLVQERKITEKEGLAKATNPQGLEMNLRGIFLDEARHILG